MAEPIVPTPTAPASPARAIPLVAQRESKIPPGCYLVAPFPLEDGATWGDLRRLVELGQHYDDDAPIKLDWTEHYATNGQITTPSGVIVEGA